MQAARAVHDRRGSRPLLRYVRVQMTCVSSLRSEASEVTASVRFVQHPLRPEELHWYVTVLLLRPQVRIPVPEEQRVRCPESRSPRSAAKSIRPQRTQASLRVQQYSTTTRHSPLQEHQPESPSGSTAAP